MKSKPMRKTIISHRKDNVATVKSPIKLRTLLQFARGSGKIMEVLEYAESPIRKGLVLMDTPAHDAESVTGLLAGGAQVIAFTTGLGTPMGSPIAPVIKIASNSNVYKKMKENMDMNAGEIITGNKSIQNIGEKIFREIIRVASGKLTKSEVLGHREFAINRIGPSF